MKIEEIYEKVQHITYRTRIDLYVHGWEKDDWDQEGIICLYNLLKQHPNLVDNLPNLYRYYKTKFRNRVIDEVRKQSNDKRKVNMNAYEDIHEKGDRIKGTGLLLDDYIFFYDTISIYKKTLAPEKKEHLEMLLADERFKGRKKMLKDMAPYFSSFG
ncbi:Competence-specific sigma factor ComX [Streptococcus sp. DD10]|uniref:hypothetical protein n=1 Tax=Streptococcus sp. DD10 TaxID=1777878 RepID=UPI000798B3A0|nr:hypothetical protein [Streptococcus sp. DD10]KXT72752.1 Competence-specific sigma factor ComX [Streptococcus sp. DD10]